MNKYFMKFILFVFLLCMIPTFPGALSEDEYIPLGSYDGDTYTNDYIGIGCTLEGWRYDTLAELAKRTRLNTDELDEELQEMLQRTKAFILMYAEAPDQTQSITVSVTYANDTQAIVDSYGMEKIVEILFPEMVASYSSLYGPNTTGRIISREIDGKMFYGYMISYIQDNEQLFFEELKTTAGNYVVTMIATASSEEIADSIYNCFFLLPE